MVFWCHLYFYTCCASTSGFGDSGSTKFRSAPPESALFVFLAQPLSSGVPSFAPLVSRLVDSGLVKNIPHFRPSKTCTFAFSGPLNRQSSAFPLLVLRKQCKSSWKVGMIDESTFSRAIAGPVSAQSRFKLWWILDQSLCPCTCVWFGVFF